MKRLKKTTLETGVKVLGDLEMKSVIGGYGDIGNFGKHYYCACRDNMAYPPLSSSWSSWYLDLTAMESDISRRCVRGGGCAASGY